MLLQAGDQLAGNFAIVDVGSHFSTGGGHLFAADRGLPLPAAPRL